MVEITNLVYHLYVYFTVIRVVWVCGEKIHFFLVNYDYSPIIEFLWKLYELLKNIYR